MVGPRSGAGPRPAPDPWSGSWVDTTGPKAGPGARRRRGRLPHNEFICKFLAACLVGSALAYGQAAPEPKPPMAEEVFKNVQVLKGIPVDEFMNTMGIFSAALGISCENCHAANDSTWANYAGDNTPKKRTARAMIGMMAAINKTYFAGRQ